MLIIQTSKRRQMLAENDHYGPEGPGVGVGVVGLS